MKACCACQVLRCAGQSESRVVCEEFHCKVSVSFSSYRRVHMNLRRGDET